MSETVFDRFEYQSPDAPTEGEVILEMPYSGYDSERPVEDSLDLLEEERR